ncbi:MAG: hypothetical protein HY505_00340 [Candidatus Yanofskybacteria bacterium]|nr:hypothetical protein [Candidatus Yanofskybacteria bacterium]
MGREISKNLKKQVLVVFFVFVFAFILFPREYSNAQNGSLYFSPSSGQFGAGQRFSVSLRVNTGGTAINATEGALAFDPVKLEIISVSRTSSILTLWANEPTFSNIEGIMDFTGGVPNPGYSGSNGLILTINFRAKTATTIEGSTEVTLVSGAILANDGYGTNILSSLGKATYAITASVIAPTLPPSVEQPIVTTTARPDITSTTHPEQDKWYSQTDPVFKWNVPPGMDEVILVLSRRSNSSPIISYIPPISEKQLTDLDDGVWYLNARFRNNGTFGSVTSFQFNIDTESPADFKITRLDTDDPTNPQPELLFKTTDAVSGIDRYEIKIGEGGWVELEPSEAGRAYAVTPQKYGIYTVEIKALDKAGNYSLSQTEIAIEPIESPLLQKVSVENDNIVFVAGSTKPGYQVLVYANDKEYEAITRENGEFSLKIADLASGEYSIHAIAKDDRGAISEPSRTFSITIRGGVFGFLTFLLVVFDRIVNLLSGNIILIALIIAIIGLALAVVELLRIHSGGWLKKLLDKAITIRIKKKSVKKVNHIIKDMREELRFLSQIAKRRPLSTDEKYLKSKLSSYIKMLKYIDDEIVKKK